MTVAVYHHAEACGLRLQGKLPEIVQQINRNLPGFDDFGFRQTPRPRAGVDITADRGYGCDLRQGIEDFRSTDIASVENEVGSAQSLDRFRSQQAVRIGDYAQVHSFSLSGFSISRFITKAASSAHRLCFPV